LLQTDILDEDKRLVSAVDYYFIQEDGSRFKVSTLFHINHFLSLINVGLCNARAWFASCSLFALWLSK